MADHAAAISVPAAEAAPANAAIPAHHQPTPQPVATAPVPPPPVVELPITAPAEPTTAPSAAETEPEPVAAEPVVAGPEAEQPALEDDDNVSNANTTSSIGLAVDTDDPDDDQDSALGDDGPSSSRVSVSSSVYHFVEEYGRTYHKYKEGKYYLPNDDAEQSRLDLQHSIALMLLKNKLYLAPIDRPHRVLDIGTGTGIWAIEFALEHPSSSVLGTDLSPIQPAFVPPNCSFEVDDIEDEWAYSSPFDYIHGRYLCLFIQDFSRMFAQVYANLRPGGHAEFMETLLDIKSVDGTVEGTHTQRWNRLVLQGIRRTGREPLSAYSYADYMARAGFEDVAVRRFYMPANTWAKGKDHKIMGALQLTNALEALLPLSLKIFVNVLGWKREDVESFCVDVRRDMLNKNIHSYTPILVVYGRKPLNG